MKEIKHEHYGAYCPKCHGELMLEVASWSDMKGDLYYVFCPACNIKGSGSNTRDGALVRYEKALEQRARIDSRKPEKILTDIRDYLVAILDEWHKRIGEPNFYEQNIGVYNHIRKELDDLTEYAKKLGVEL